MCDRGKRSGTCGHCNGGGVLCVGCRTTPVTGLILMIPYLVDGEMYEKAVALCDRAGARLEGEIEAMEERLAKLDAELAKLADAKSKDDRKKARELRSEKRKIGVRLTTRRAMLRDVARERTEISEWI